MLNHFLENSWRAFALVLVLFLGLKFYAALHADLYALLAAMVLIALFYCLFLLEGLQMAGMQLKDHCDEAILRFIETSHVGNDERSLRIAELYKKGFHSFLSGRQILVIMSVVSIASIISFLKLQPELLDIAISMRLAEVVNSPLINFLLSTLLPAWISQLLPQFIADNRSIAFVSLPGAEWITRLAIRLDRIQASRPAFDLLEWARKSSTFGMKEKIHVGRQRFFESLSSYIGISRDKVLIVICGDRVTERSSYRIRKEKLVTLRHKIRPQSEIDEFNISLSTKDNIVTGKPSIEKSYDREGLFYLLEVTLSFDNDLHDSFADIDVINEYEHKGMSAAGNEFILFETDVPTRTVSVILMPDKQQQLSDISVDAYHHAQRHFYDDDSFAYGIVEISSDNSNHRVDIDYPLYGIEYRVNYRHQCVQAENEQADRSQSCEMQVKGAVEQRGSEYKTVSFTLPTQGLDELVHLKGDEEKSRPH